MKLFCMVVWGSFQLLHNSSINNYTLHFETSLHAAENLGTKTLLFMHEIKWKEMDGTSY